VPYSCHFGRNLCAIGEPNGWDLGTLGSLLSTYGSPRRSRAIGIDRNPGRNHCAANHPMLPTCPCLGQLQRSAVIREGQLHPSKPTNPPARSIVSSVPIAEIRVLRVSVGQSKTRVIQHGRLFGGMTPDNDQVICSSGERSPSEEDKTGPCYSSACSRWSSERDTAAVGLITAASSWLHRR
jgi:hypothetical protein